MHLSSQRECSSNARILKGQEPLVGLESVSLVTHVRVDRFYREARVLSGWRSAAYWQIREANAEHTERMVIPCARWVTDEKKISALQANSSFTGNVSAS